MRKKSQKVDHLPMVKLEDSLDGDFSGYDSSDSGLSSGEIDVKEALRSSICLKSKLQRLNNYNDHVMSRKTSPNLEHHDDHDDIDYDDADDVSDALTRSDLTSQPKKERKPKKLEDVESAAIRRERNRLAAQRCRQRRRDRIEKLEKVCDKLQNEGDKLGNEISDLQGEMEHLQKILGNHKCMAHMKVDNYAYEMKYDARISS